MQITGGKVTFGRSVQPAQYETKKAEVEIAFTLSEGEDLGDTLDKAGALAQGKALELVGLKVAAPVSAKVEPPKSEPPVKTKADLEAEALTKAGGNKEGATTTKTTRKTPPKSTAKPEETLDADAAAHAATIAQNTVKNGETVERQVSTNPENRTDPALDIPGDDPLSVPAQAMTDAELTSAVTQHNAKIKNPTAIRALIMKFVGKTPCQVIDIKPENRAKFVEELKKL